MTGFEIWPWLQLKFNIIYEKFHENQNAPLQLPGQYEGELKKWFLKFLATGHLWDCTKHRMNSSNIKMKKREEVISVLKDDSNRKNIILIQYKSESNCAIKF